jgi:hypothetical protein
LTGAGLTGYKELVRVSFSPALAATPGLFLFNMALTYPLLWVDLFPSKFQRQRAFGVLFLRIQIDPC